MATPCEECGNCHLPGSPHNVYSWQYMKLYLATRDRLPTQRDAVAHCSDKVKDTLKQLAAKGQG